MHEKARDFFMNVFPKLKMYMSMYQLVEIYHVLAFRGAKVPRSYAKSIVKAIMEDGNIIKVAVTLDHIEEAVRESVESGIHV